ncbi:polysaccharide deacetylase family protein [Haladaptatus halobius]|uniref:polysaccharide deacetylase family protein n=1 Tax=Haladaptatus halobius TaxID=2884875 RepID=UPI001D0A08D3|nr:polysaccharide deacetylase family protein [Haladaptatus halobius]
MGGVITISLEIELGWGYHDLGQFNRLSENRRKETKTIQRLLNVCDKYDIPLTFNIVGHLLQKHTPSSETPHMDGWFDSIPSKGDPLFYAPDIVRAIQQANTDHEICTHTHSHVICGKASDRVLDWELQQAKKAHREIGEPKPVSLVPPRHSLPSKDRLRRNDIEIIRRIGYAPALTPFHKFNQLVFEPPDPIEPRLVDGIVETYCSKYSTLSAATLPSGAEPPLPMFRAVPTAVRQRLHRRYLTRAMNKVAEQDSYIHLWSHLHNLANDEQWQPIRSFLKTLADRRDSNELTVMPMKVLNKHVRAQNTKTPNETLCQPEAKSLIEW